MIRVSQGQAANFILQKNHLTFKKADNVTSLVNELAGLPSDHITTPFLSTYVRLDQFEPGHLLNELYQTRKLIQGILMRGSSYLVSVDSYLAWHAATARQRNQYFNSQFRLWGIEDNKELERLGEAVIEALGDQPATAQVIAKRLPQNLVRELTQTSRGGRVSKTSNVDLTLRWLTARGRLCASQDITPNWRAEHVTYAPLDHWYPGLGLSALPREVEAQTALVRAYLSAFGPATEADISFWTGFGKSETARAIGTLSADTTLVLVESIPGTLLMLKNQADMLQATEAPREPVANVLPADDPYTTAHRASRIRYFTDPTLQRHVFSSSGAAKPAILIDGAISGVWEWKIESGQNIITWRLLTEVGSALAALIQTEIERVGAFIDPDTVVGQDTD